jgi:hypothetical protein
MFLFHQVPRTRNQSGEYYSSLTDERMAEWLNAISRLGLRSQANGEGNYRDAYEKREKRHGQQLWEVCMHRSP